MLREQPITLARVVLRRLPLIGGKRDESASAAHPREAAATLRAPRPERVIAAGVENDNRDPRPASAKAVPELVHVIGAILRRDVVGCREVRRQQQIFAVDLHPMAGVIEERRIPGLHLAEEVLYRPLERLLIQIRLHGGLKVQLTLQELAEILCIVDGIFQGLARIGPVADYQRYTAAAIGSRHADSSTVWCLSRANGGDHSEQAERSIHRRSLSGSIRQTGTGMCCWWPRGRRVSRRPAPFCATGGHHHINYGSSPAPNGTQARRQTRPIPTPLALLPIDAAGWRQ